MKALKTLAVLCVLTAGAMTTSATQAGVTFSFGKSNQGFNQHHNFNTFGGGNFAHKGNFNHNFVGQPGFGFNQNFNHQGGNFKVIFVNGKKVVVFVGNGGNFGHNGFNTFNGFGVHH